MDQRNAMIDNSNVSVIERHLLEGLLKNVNTKDAAGNRSMPSENPQPNQRLIEALLKTKQSYSVAMKKLQTIRHHKKHTKNKKVQPNGEDKDSKADIKSASKIDPQPKSKQTRNLEMKKNIPSKSTKNVSDRKIVRLPTHFSSRQDLLKYINAQKLERRKESMKLLKFVHLNMRWNSGNVAQDYYRRRNVKTDKEKAALAGLKNECYDWTYDAADYTLIYNPTKTFQREKCSYPTNETVKRIITPNKKVIWKGCTKRTPACSLRGHFDEKRNVRRNTPPCCRHHLLEMLGNIDRELTRHNITYTIADGAVIGWYRNGKLVPYDNDIDMYVDGTYFKTQTWDDVFKGLATKYGYEYKQTEDYKYRLRYSEVNGLQVDIWPYFNIKLRTHYGEVKPGEWVTFVYHSSTTAMRVNEFFPPIRTTIEGVPCNVPRDVVNYLNKNYGPTPDNWYPELTCKTIKSYRCA